jgi:hypothetical protein
MIVKQFSEQLYYRSWAGKKDQINEWRNMFRKLAERWPGKSGKTFSYNSGQNPGPAVPR